MNPCFINLKWFLRKKKGFWVIHIMKDLVTSINVISFVLKIEGFVGIKNQFN